MTFPVELLPKILNGSLQTPNPKSLILSVACPINSHTGHSTHAGHTPTKPTHKIRPMRKKINTRSYIKLKRFYTEEKEHQQKDDN